MIVSRRRFLLTGLAVLAVPRGARAGCPTDNNVLQIRKRADVYTFDPVDCAYDDELLIRSINGALVRARSGMKAGEQGWVEHSADSLKWLDDRRLEFRLPQGMKWTRGSGEVTASDVAYSFERVTSSPATRHRIRWDQLDRVEVRDRRTGIVHLKAPDPDLVSAALLHACGCIVSAESLNSDKSRRIKDRGTANGPAPAAVSGRYVVEDYKVGNRIVLVCNRDSTGAASKIRKVELLIVSDDKTADALAQSEGLVVKFEADHLNEMSPSALAQVLKNADLENLPGLTSSYLALNVEDPVLKDADVRTAIKLALNVDRAVEAAYGKYGKRATGLVPSILAGARTANERPRQDLNQAKKLLRGRALDLVMYVAANTVGTRLMAASINNDLANVGIKVEQVFGNPFTALQDKKRISVTLLRREAPPSSRLILQPFLDKTANLAAFSSETFSNLVRKMSDVREPAQRVRLAQEAQDLLERQGVVVPLAEERTLWIRPKNVRLPFTWWGGLGDLGDAFFVP
jgi:peptide/nickel transport system substrate-binding protein